jgi:hypothetical protein
MRLESVWLCVLGMAFPSALTTLVPMDASAQGQRPQAHGVSVLEATQLPKFCWSQYLDVKGPEYEINGCGPAMNHYCEGLVELIRANKNFGNTHVRVAHLQRARFATLYTIGGMKGFPTCWLRPHAENTRKQIDAALRVYGVK